MYDHMLESFVINAFYRRCSSQSAYNENRRFSGEPKQKMMGTFENRVNTYTQSKLRKKLSRSFSHDFYSTLL